MASASKSISAPPVPHQVESAGEEEIRQRAYALYEQRGGESGHDLEDWLQAEAELGLERSS